MGSFHMPSSWYDPPEYSFQKQAESICDKGLWGLYETNPETGKVIRDDIIPDVIGTEAEIMAEYNQMVEDYEEDGKQALFETVDLLDALGKDGYVTSKEVLGYMADSVIETLNKDSHLCRTLGSKVIF